MIKKILRRLFALLLIAVLVTVAWSAFKEHRYRQSMPLVEVISPAEDAAMADAVAMALKMINMTRDDLIDHEFEGDATLVGSDYSKMQKLKPGEAAGPTAGTRQGPVVFRRDVHIKSHGCVKAWFTVPQLEDRYRWGVFRNPKQYRAWIRFSNGQFVLNPDSTPDARGMAIKLLEVPGKKLLDREQDATTQDFIMMNRPNYFIRHLEDYIELTKYLAVNDAGGYFTNDKSPNLFGWRWRELRLVAGSFKKAPDTPLTSRYWSASAYVLGPDQYVKFGVRPAQCRNDAGEPEPAHSGDWATDRDDYNFLRLRMAEQLQAGPACFDFMMQTQVPGEPMPVEDATIIWSEKTSPFVPVAHIEVPQQTFNNDAQNQFCEDLSFNPWHSLPDHRPVGVFNRVRKALYDEVAKYRWASNRQQYRGESAIALDSGQPPEPEGWCLDGERGDCAPSTAR